MAILRGNIGDYRKTKDDMVAKVTIIKTDSLSLDVYYFKAGREKRSKLIPEFPAFLSG